MRIGQADIETFFLFPGTVSARYALAETTIAMAASMAGLF